MRILPVLSPVLGCAVLGVAGCVSGPRPSLYGDRAVRITNDIEQRYWDPAEKAYLDVTPKRTEGLPYAMMWANGIEFTVLAGASAADPDTYAPLMRRFLDTMERFRNSRRGLYSAYFGGTEDVYYDDNQWLILAYIEAYEVTGDPVYLETARGLADACLAGVDEVRGGGSYWHVDTAKHPTKNTCSNGPLATALLRLAKHVPDAQAAARYRQQGADLLKWVREALQDEKGLMLDNINVKTGKITDWRFTYNTALVLAAELEMYEATKEQAHLDEAIRMAAAADHWLREDGTGVGYYDDAAFFTVHLVEALLNLERITGDARLLENCRRTADAYLHAWYPGAPLSLINISSVARMQWLLAQRLPTLPPVAASGTPGAVHSVRVTLEGRKEVLSLAEVEVLSDGRNVAPGGRALQSSVFEGCVASRAIDGNTGGDYAAGEITHTSHDQGNPWWEVELAEPCEVEAVRLWNRTDACRERLTGARVIALDADRNVIWSRAIGDAPERDVLVERPD